MKCYLDTCIDERVEEYFPFCSQSHHTEWADKEYGRRQRKNKVSKFEAFLKGEYMPGNPYAQKQLAES